MRAVPVPVVATVPEPEPINATCSDAVCFDPLHFDAMYAGTDDPWHLRTRWYEQRKRALTLACLPAARFGSAYEPGCAGGELSLALASRCDRLLISDASPQALQVARQRTAGLAHVQACQAQLPQDWPAQRFDLIVLSEVAYYLTAVALDQLAQRLREALLPHGALLACHWRAPIAGCAMTGDEVHRRLTHGLSNGLRNGLALSTLCSYRDDDLVLDVWSPDALSVAEREGFKTAGHRLA